MPKPTIETCFTPELLHLYELDGKIAVVIDIFRATSSMCVALHCGAEKIIPVDSVAQSRQYQQKGYLVAGERHGRKIEGFDYGNSPRELRNGRIDGKTLVMTTTNGTHAIEKTKSAAREVVIGAFLNQSRLTEWLHHQQRHVLLLCAGWRRHFNLEDTLFAGAVAQSLEKQFEVTGDASIAAMTLYRNAEDNLLPTLKAASHYHRLKQMGEEEDMQYCLQPDRAPVLPIWKAGALVNAGKTGNPKSILPA